MHRRVGIFSENKKKQGLVVTERDPSDHTAGLIVHHIDIFIARPVAGRFECSDDIAQALLKAVLRIKRQATDAGVQAIGAHNKVATSGYVSPSRRRRKPVSASHKREADSVSVSSTSCKLNAERLMTLRTSAVAVCC